MGTRGPRQIALPPDAIPVSAVVSIGGVDCRVTGFDTPKCRLIGVGFNGRVVGKPEPSFLQQLWKAIRRRIEAK